MASSRLSQSSSLRIVASVFATIFTGFGINAIMRPQNALEFFEFEPPASASGQKLVDNLMVIYGVRDIFMGVAMYSAAYFGDRKTLGWIVIAGSGVAFADGAVCWAQGKGEWNHWGYAPILTAVGSLLLGALDRNEILNIEPPNDDEMFQLFWDPRVLDLPIYQRDDRKIELARTFSVRLRTLGFRTGYGDPLTTHDFRAGLYLIDKFYSSAQRMRHGGHRDEDTYNEFYASRNPTLAPTAKAAIWAEHCSLPAEKQHELTESREYLDIEEELGQLLHLRDDATSQTRRKELHAQKRKLINNKLRQVQRN
ncbi:MAG: hypothetical protein Q9190_004257 [Brigantiaea leucoxantha]